MLKLRNQVAVAGTAFSRIARRSGASLGALAVEAVAGAAADAGLEPRQIDGVSIFSHPGRLGAGLLDGVDQIGPSYLARVLGLPEVRWTCSLAAGSFGGSIVEAVNAVAAGACTIAVAVRAMNNPGARYSSFAEEVAAGPYEFTAPYGLASYGMQYAMPYSRYLAIFGAQREHMATFVVANRANAQRNPESVFRGAPLSQSDYLEDRWFAEPLSYLDSDMAVDGAGAVIVTTAERARTLRRPPAYVLGYGSIGVDVATTPVVTLESLEAGARLLAASLWASSGLGPADVDQANLYDGFSFFVYLWLEALGFCGRGEAFEFVQDGRVGLGGPLPLNTNGGSLGMGRLHGPAHVIEAVRQVQGLAGERQVAGARVTLACTGSPLNAGALLFTSDPSA